MNFYEAKLQGTLAPIKKLSKCFPSMDTLFQCRSKQNRSRYNADGSKQADHKKKAVKQRIEDFMGETNGSKT